MELSQKVIILYLNFRNNRVAFEIKRDSFIIDGKKYVNVELIKLNATILL